jgi:hypothetical protein
MKRIDNNLDNKNTPFTFNTRVAKELKMFTEMISLVWEQFDVKWSNNSHEEIGFYYRNKIRKTEYFFGIWYDLWEHYEIPLSITFKYTGKAPVQWHDKVKAYILSKNIEGIRVVNFEGYICILFEYNFFKFDSGDDIDRLSEVYCDFTEYAETIKL